MRRGPLRVAVLATADAAQAASAVAAVDRWVARRGGEVRACAPAGAPAAPRPGTYAVDAPGGATEAWIAAPLPADDESSRSAATYVAALLDDPDGPLGRALAGPALARAWSARVVGPARGGALIVRVTTTPAALDAAVAATRAVLDRLRRGPLEEASRARAVAARARGELRASLDPRGRVAALWRGELGAGKPAPSLDALAAFCASSLRDDALVFVAVRPPPIAKGP